MIAPTQYLPGPGGIVPPWFPHPDAPRIMLPCRWASPSGRHGVRSGSAGGPNAATFPSGTAAHPVRGVDTSISTVAVLLGANLLTTGATRG